MKIESIEQPPVPEDVIIAAPDVEFGSLFDGIFRSLVFPSPYVSVDSGLSVIDDLPGALLDYAELTSSHIVPILRSVRMDEW